MEELVEAHELLIQELEILEREFDQLRAAKARSEERLKREIRELRRQLRLTLDEVSELQSLLSRAWVRT